MRKIYRQLSADERVQIATLRGQGYVLARIAQVLGRHRATVWREVQRNRAPYDGGYRSARPRACGGPGVNARGATSSLAAPR